MNYNYTQKRMHKIRTFARVYLALCFLIATKITWSAIMAFDHDELAHHIAIVLVISLPLFSAALTYAGQQDFSFFGISMLSLSIFIHWGMKCLIMASEPELGHYVFLGFDSIWAYVTVLIFGVMLPGTMYFAARMAEPVRKLFQRL